MKEHSVLPTTLFHHLLLLKEVTIDAIIVAIAAIIVETTLSEVH
jgi:hypothetical protein